MGHNRGKNGALLKSIMGNFKSIISSSLHLIICAYFVYTVEVVHYKHLGTDPDYQGVLIFQVILYDKVPCVLRLSAYVDYVGGLIFKCPHYGL